MKVLVCVKRVVDYNVKIRVKADGSGVDLNNVKMAMNPFDEIALEEAMRLLEAGIASEIVAVSIGGAAVQETLRTALAFGAHRAIHMTADDVVEPLHVAKLLCKVTLNEQPAIVLLGKQAIDDDCNQVGQMLAALLAWPQATFVSQLVVEDKHVLATREVDGGLETLNCPLPCVLTTDLRLNEPRYISLPNIMKAKRKPIDTVDAASLTVTHQARMQVLKVMPPKQRQSGVMVASVTELVDKLKNEAKVI